ncbi:MAG: TIGR02147 family protein [Bdellovibrionales bacterium]|nr:TIGR02147 family protein [Bdellovibrionales bacterium]
MVKKTKPYIVVLIEREFERRKQKNPKYSLRSFGRYLGMDSSTLSSILRGKRKLGVRSVAKFLKLLDVTAAERAAALKSMVGEEVAAPVAAQLVDERTLEVIRGWEHAAILMLTALPDFRLDAGWIAQKLVLPVTRIEFALKRLLDLRLLVEENGKWQAMYQNFTTTQDIPSETLRTAHRELIQKAGESLDRDPVGTRDITGITLPADTKRLAQAKSILERCRWEISELLREGDVNAVYHLNMQLFPLTKVEIQS